MDLKGDILPLMLLVEEIEEEEITKSGIITSLTVKKPSMKGKVVKIGKGTVDFEMVHEEGQIVLYSPHSGGMVEIEGKEYRLMAMKEAWYRYWPDEKETLIETNN